MFSSSRVTSVVGFRPIKVSSAWSGYSMPSNPPLRITSLAPGIRTHASARLRIRLRFAGGPSELAVAQRRHARAHALELGERAVGHRDARRIAELGERDPPWIHDQRSAVARALRAVDAALGRGEHEALVLDR